MLAAKTEGAIGVVTFSAFINSFRDAPGDVLRELDFEAVAVDGTLAVEPEVAPGASKFREGAREVVLVVKPACGPDVRLLYAFPFIFVGPPGFGLGVSTPSAAGPIETLPFGLGSESAVGVCFSLAAVLFKVSAVRSAARTSDIEEADAAPNVADTEVGTDAG